MIYFIFSIVFVFLLSAVTRAKAETIRERRKRIEAEEKLAEVGRSLKEIDSLQDELLLEEIEEKYFGE